MTESGVEAGKERISYLEVDRHDSKIIDELAHAPIYKKQGEVNAIMASGGETVETRLADGTVETTNTASEGDYIVTNPGGERYVVERETFEKRYEPKEGEEGVYTAQGYCKAIDNPFGKPIKMLASWDEMQTGNSDCKIADTYEPGTQELGGEPYIIGKEQFEETYRLA